MFPATFTIILVLALEIVSSQVTPEMKEALLNGHNKIRKQAISGEIPGQPAAASLPDLKWNDELAIKAQEWADNCKSEHDSDDHRRIPAFENVGQNWAGTGSVEDGLNMWFEEYKQYKFDDMTCTEVCTHYTQIIWAATKEVGCGVKDCGTGESYPFGLSIVCDYGPAGNWNDEHPYEKKGSTGQRSL